MLTYGGEAAAEYPLNVYAAWFRDILIFVVPIGCVTYLPMLAAMGAPTRWARPPGRAARAGRRVPLPGRFALHLAFGIRHYASAGGKLRPP